MQRAAARLYNITNEQQKTSPTSNNNVMMVVVVMQILAAFGRNAYDKRYTMPCRTFAKNETEYADLYSQNPPAAQTGARCAGISIYVFVIKLCCFCLRLCQLSIKYSPVACARKTHLNFGRRSQLHARHEKIIRITLVRRFVVPVTLMVMMVWMQGMLVVRLLLLLVRWSTGHRCPAGSIVVHVRIVCNTKRLQACSFVC